MILYSDPLYEWISRWLGVFERKRAHRDEVLDLTTEESGVDVILFGLGGSAPELRGNFGNEATGCSARISIPNLCVGRKSMVMR